MAGETMQGSCSRHSALPSPHRSNGGRGGIARGEDPLMGWRPHAARSAAYPGP